MLGRKAEKQVLQLGWFFGLDDILRYMRHLILKFNISVDNLRAATAGIFNAGFCRSVAFSISILFLAQVERKSL